MKEYSLNIFGKEYCQVYGGYGKQEWNVEWEREICAGTPVKKQNKNSLFFLLILRQITKNQMQNILLVDMIRAPEIQAAH